MQVAGKVTSETSGDPRSLRVPLAFAKVFLECQAGKVDNLTKSLKKKE
jgi:hypothetical protein